MDNDKYRKLIYIFLTVIFIIAVVSAFVGYKNFSEFKENILSKGNQGRYNSGEVNLNENEIKIASSGEVKSGINGRIEADGYDESKISYKSYDGVKNIQNFELTNLKVGKINGSRSLFLADTKNNTKEFQKSIKVRISVIDENDEVKETFSAIINELAGLESGKFKAQVLSDITYAKDFKIEVVNE